jgi:hypothetical protein
MHFLIFYLAFGDTNVKYYGKDIITAHKHLGLNDRHLDIFYL